MRKLFLIMMTLVAVSWSVSAQTRTYSGTVVDAANNEPLIGATVMPIGGGQGVATDIDGNFTLNLPASVKSVKVSYVGYKEQTVAVSHKMVVRLVSSSTNLDDVVVVAYGTANKESLTGSVAVVGAKEIEERPVTNVMNALEGSAPGVNVNSSTGYPGSSPQIRIRGFNSFDSSAQGPLYVVDGIVYNGDIADINPADVESMSVLKDAASCALYGSRGANGVVLVTTKKAKGQGRVEVNLQMNWGAYGLALPLYDRLGANDWMEASLMGMANGEVYASGYTTSYADAILNQKDRFVSGAYLLNTNIYGIQNPDGTWTPAENGQIFNDQGKIADGVAVLPGYNDLDWWKAITQTGFREEYNLNVAGATDKFDMFGSISYLNQKGYVIETDFSRYTGRFTANYQPVSYFRSGMNLATTYSKGSITSFSSLDAVTNPFLTMFYTPVQSIYEHDENGEIMRNPDGTPIYSIGGLNGGGNLIWATRLNKQKNDQLTMDASLYGTAIIPYGFEVTVRGSLYKMKTTYTAYSNNKEGSQKGVGGLDEEFDDVRSYNFSQALTWSHEYGDHHIDALFHHENYKVQSGYSFFRASGQKLDNNYTMGNFDEVTAQAESLGGYNTESYLGRVRYNYDQKYFAEFSLNRDGSSQFAKDHRWGTFWSVGASWIISKEKFMHSLNWLNYLKLRAAYGTVGNNQACSTYNYLTLFAFSSTGGLRLGQLAAPDLKWESTNTLDLALEGSLFNDRFTFSIGYFDKRNADLIYALRLPWSSGTLGNSGSLPYQYTNVGEMQNYGWELMFGVDIIRNANVLWDFNIDASFITNKIKKLPNGENLPGSALFQGKSRYVNYDYEWAGVDMTNGRSLYYMNPDSPDYWKYDENHNAYYDEEAYLDMVDGAKADGSYVEIDGVPYTYKTNYAGRRVISDALPVVYGSFGSSVTWKGLRLGLLFTYSLGGQTFDSNYASMMGMTKSNAKALHKDVLKGWTSAPEGMTADSPDRINSNAIPQLNSELSQYSTASSSQYLTSASYLSLKNVNLTYNLPQSWVSALKLQNISVGFMMDNAFILTARKGLNAQSALNGVVGSNGAYYQPARTYTFQLGVKF